MTPVGPGQEIAEYGKHAHMPKNEATELQSKRGPKT